MRRYLLLTLVSLGCLAPCRAQLPPGLPIPPENYAVPHVFGSANVVSMDYVALGGAFVAEDRDDWHGNPAAVAALRRPTVNALFQSAGFEAIPTANIRYFAYAHPLGRRGALKLSYARVRASGALAGTGLSAEVHEDAPGLEYGWRVNPKLVLGVASADLRTRSEYILPGTGTVTTLRSRPAGLGGARVGAIYAVNERLSLGGFVDVFRERVTQSVPVLGTPENAFTFTTQLYRMGLAFRPDASSRILLDYETSRVTGNDVTIKRRPWMLGGERRIRDLALRLGCFAGKLTGGLGWERGNTRLSYAFTGRYDKDLPGQGAETAHGIELTVGL